MNRTASARALEPRRDVYDHRRRQQQRADCLRRIHAVVRAPAKVDKRLPRELPVDRDAKRAFVPQCDLEGVVYIFSVVRVPVLPRGLLQVVGIDLYVAGVEFSVDDELQRL
jgi:hypothetical protein